MGVFEDTYDELKKAKPGEKALIIGGALAVLGVALYLHSKSSAAQPYQAATPASSGTGTGGAASGWGTVGPNQTPILPGGYCPQYDPNGNLVDYAPCGTTPGPKPPPGPPKPPPKPPGPPKPPPKKPPRPQGNPPPPIIKRRNVDIIVRHNQQTQVAQTYARRATPAAPAWQPPAARMPPPNWQPTRVGTAGIPPIQYPVGKPTRIS